MIMEHSWLKYRCLRCGHRFTEETGSARHQRIVHGRYYVWLASTQPKSSARCCVAVAPQQGSLAQVPWSLQFKGLYLISFHTFFSKSNAIFFFVLRFHIPLLKLLPNFTQSSHQFTQQLSFP